MTKQIYFILFPLLILCAELQSQKNTERLATEDKKKITALRAGIYLDNGVHPGLKIGTSYLLGEKEKSKPRKLKYFQKKRGNSLKNIQYLADGNLGFYQHPNNHAGVFLGIGFTRQRNKTRLTRNGKEKQRTIAWSLETNYLRRFYNIETFELNDNGEIQKVGAAGTNSLMFAISPSFGRYYDMKKGAKGFHLFIKPSLQLLKYNHAFFPNASLEIGVNLNIF